MSTNPKFARPAVAAIGIFALLGAAPAFAADVVMEEPPAPAAPLETPPVNTWSGPYAGISLGYGFSGRTSTPGNDIDTDGFVGSGFGGFNFQNGMFVYGAEADLGYAGFSGDNAGTSSKSGLDGSLRARMGVAVTDNVLLYGKMTENVFGRVEYRYTDFGSRTFNTGSGPQAVDASDNRVMFGIGMKF